MIRVTLHREKAITQGGLELLEGWSEEGEDSIWVDITGGTQEDIEPLLEEWFRFHELAAEDSLSASTLPKYDPFPRYDFFVFRSINLDLVQHGISTLKIAVFLGKNFLFTIHKEPLPAAANIWDRLPYDQRIMLRGVDFLMYSILDVVVDSHFPLLEEIEERIDEIQTLIFAQASQSLLDELLHLKRDLNVLRRNTLPQRDLFSQISRGASPFVKPEHLIYFRDLYDHMFRISESIDVERDLASGTMDAYLSVIANRTNEIMKVLTIFSSILLPMNFIAGIYGMNFEHMPELKWKYGYAFAFLVMGLILLLMLFWFWRLGWLGSKRAAFFEKERAVRRALRRRMRARGELANEGSGVAAGDVTDKGV